MAIRIRTGANGAYKSSYVAYYVVLDALKSGRVVVTNISGMQPLEEIEKRLDIKFPSTTKLIRISSRNESGLELWQYFFCWAPIGALIVIDECQDIFSKNIGFDLRKIRYRPLSDFLPNLPSGYENLFNSRHVPVDLDSLDPADTDDCGKQEYDSDGRIIYPFSFNEGFMRHRHYNWDIELLSPDWKQIDSGIKACAEECFFHKGRDGFLFGKRKPYIYRHKKDATTPSLPVKKDPNLLTVKIPLEAFLLYKSTSTGKAQSSGQMNVLLKNPLYILVFVIGLSCLGYFIYGLSGLAYNLFAQSEEDTDSQTLETSSGSVSVPAQVDQSSSDLSRRGNSDKAGVNPVASPDYVTKLRSVLQLDDVNRLYYMGHVLKKTNNGVSLSVTLEAISDFGTYYLTETYLNASSIKYVHFDDCLLKLSNSDYSLNVSCKPVEYSPPVSEPISNPSISLF